MNKILIAEDEPAIANLVKTALDGPDYRCAWAADGLSAADIGYADLILNGDPEQYLKAVTG